MLTRTRRDGGECRRPLLVCARQRHGALKIPRCLEFDVDTNGFRETAREEVNLLLRGQVVHMSHFGEERLLEVCYRTTEWQTCELGEMVDAQSRTEALTA
jgi:hypothetical protein